jgi:hypothetical protein
MSETSIILRRGYESRKRCGSADQIDKPFSVDLKANAPFSSALDFPTRKLSGSRLSSKSTHASEALFAKISRALRTSALDAASVRPLDLKSSDYTVIPRQFLPVSPHSGNGQLQGGNAICSRGWLAAPPLVLLLLLSQQGGLLSIFASLRRITYRPLLFCPCWDSDRRCRWRGTSSRCCAADSRPTCSFCSWCSPCSKK